MTVMTIQFILKFRLKEHSVFVVERAREGDVRGSKPKIPGVSST